MTLSLLEAVRAPGPTLMAGAFDAFTARLAQRAGFASVYLSGSATAAAAFGKPDLGLVTMSEMAEQCRRMAQAVSTPIMADGDTGYGDQNAVRRTVQSFEASGVSGITLEDQTWPKRCGYMEGLGVVDDEEISVRIAAAVAARRSPGFAIIGRTDSLAPTDLDTAVRRGQTIAAAGADVVWIVGLQQLADDELARVRRSFDIPLLVDHTELPNSPVRTAADYGRLGFDVVLFPLASILVTMKALSTAFAAMVAEGGWNSVLDSIGDFEEYNSLAGLDDELEFSARFTRLPDASGAVTPR